jgi:hypothetical protein
MSFDSYLMNGTHFAKEFVNSYLEQDLPIRLIRYRNGWNLDDRVLPNPEQYIGYEPLAIDRWPSIITVVMSTNQMNRIGFEFGHPLYRVSYSMRTYCWVRTEGIEECPLMRDRLTTVVRSALLDYPCLKAYDSRSNFRVLIDESSIREEFSDTTLLKGDRFMSGSFISYILEMDETVTRTDLGTIGEIQFGVKNVGTGEEMASLDDGSGISASISIPRT